MTETIIEMILLFVEGHAFRFLFFCLTFSILKYLINDFIVISFLFYPSLF